jgi:uncharacterized repeat protein (TIGR02543 family)
MPAHSVTLYAKWEEIPEPPAVPTYTVSYDGNENTGGEVPVDGNQYEETAEVTVLGNPGNLVKTGYTFEGWYITEGEVVTSFPMPAYSVTLYAKWAEAGELPIGPPPAPTYTVSYDGNGNTGGEVPVDGNQYEEAAEVPVPGNPGNLVKTGYTFEGWYMTAGEVVTSFRMPANPVTLYAKWAEEGGITEPSNPPEGGGTEESQDPPGGTDPEVAPRPQNPDSEIVFGDNGNYIEIDAGGVPLGEWHYDDNEGIWIFDTYPPLAGMPKTGDGGTPVSVYFFLLTGMCLLGTGLISIIRSREEEKRRF